MSAFSLSRVDELRRKQQSHQNEVIDIKFPSELKDASVKIPLKKKELLIFIVDDDPTVMQILNTHFAKLQLTVTDHHQLNFSVKNYATGSSCLKDLSLKPDIIFLNYEINKELPNTLHGFEILDEIIKINPNQKVAILNELDRNLRHAFVENGLRDFLVKDESALNRLNELIAEIVTQ